MNASAGGYNARYAPRIVNLNCYTTLEAWVGGVFQPVFADGHAEIHQWKGSKIRAKVTYGKAPLLQLNVPAGDSWNDVYWWAKNTTVGPGYF